MRKSNWATVLGALMLAATFGTASAWAQQPGAGDAQPPTQPGQSETQEQSAQQQDRQADQQTQQQNDAQRDANRDDAQRRDVQRNDAQRDDAQRDNAQRDDRRMQRDRRGALGITLMESQDGIYVRSVAPGSPAEEAGLKNGDRILSVGDQEFRSANELARHISSQQADSELKLKIHRDGEEQELTATLAKPGDVAFRDPANLPGPPPEGRYRALRPEMSDNAGGEVAELRQQLDQLRREVQDLRQMVTRFQGEGAGQQPGAEGAGQQPGAADQGSNRQSPTDIAREGNDLTGEGTQRGAQETADRP